MQTENLLLTNRCSIICDIFFKQLQIDNSSRTYKAFYMKSETHKISTLNHIILKSPKDGDD